MFNKKRVTPEKLRKLNDKSFKRTQKFFRRRLLEIAKNGNKTADFNKKSFAHETEIIAWLRSLGFTVESGIGKYYITWPESVLPAHFKRTQYAHPDSKPVREGKPKWYLHHWTKDIDSWDYVCSCCNEHSEYETSFCPNCGAKMLKKEVI